MQKILIVEDDLAIQALLHDFIQEAGYSVELASDGVEALSRFSEQNFDLVLLDIMLPKIDGYTPDQADQIFPHRFRNSARNSLCYPDLLLQEHF